jgi:hypothetical protein
LFHEEALAAACCELGAGWGAALLAESRARVAAAATARRLQVAAANFRLSVHACARVADVPQPLGELRSAGPARDVVRAHLAAAHLPRDAVAKADADRAWVKVAVGKARGDLSHAVDLLDQARARLGAETEAAAAEAGAMARATAEAERAATAEAALEAERLRGKSEELARCSSDLARLEAAYATCLAELTAILEGDEALGAELHGAYLELQAQAAAHDLPAPAVKLAVKPGAGKGLADEKALNAQLLADRGECDLLTAHAEIIQQNITALRLALCLFLVL